MAALLLIRRSALTRTPLSSPHKNELFGARSRQSLTKWKHLNGAASRRGISTTSVCDQDGKSDMTFQQYRKLSKKIKNVSRVPGLVVGLLSCSGSIAVASYVNPTMFQAPPEEVDLILGLDPIMATTFAGLGAGVVAYLLTSMSVAAIWKQSHKQLKQWDKNFLSRLDKHRYMEVNKFEDDYYGDKIKTLSDYRQWVRKQHKRRDDLKVQTSSSNLNSSSSTDTSSSSTN